MSLKLKKSLALSSKITLFGGFGSTNYYYYIITVPLKMLCFSNKCWWFIIFVIRDAFNHLKLYNRQPKIVFLSQDKHLSHICFSNAFDLFEKMCEWDWQDLSQPFMELILSFYTGY